jgi:protein-disulfide isomerase
MLKDYGDKIQFVFKNYPLPTQPLAASAALAGECANAQGKFLAYADKLFGAQDSWTKMKDATGLFKVYALQTGLNSADFNKCLDSKQLQPLIDATTTQGQQFGIQATPAMFIGDNFQDGLVKYDDVKKIIDEQLAK